MRSWHHYKPSLRAVALSLALVVIVIAAWHYWVLYASLTGGRADLLRVQQQLQAAGVDVAGPDLDAAEARLDSARRRIGRARSHLAWDPLLRAIEFVPALGNQVTAADDFLDIAGLLVEAGDEATAIGREAVRAREGRGRPDRTAGRPAERLTVTLVELLDAAGPRLERIADLVDRVVEIRLRVGDRRLLGPLDRARAQLDRDLPGMAVAVRRGSQLRELLPGLLGFEGERRYMVFALNNAELFPGGGFLSAAGVLTVTEGEPGDVEFSDTNLWKPLWEARGGGYIEPPGPLRRYLLKDFSWNLPTSNWSPDFPTWSQQSLEFYELVYGPQNVDGIVAVDMETLVALLRVLGPRELQAPGYGRVTLTEENAVLELERVTRPSFAKGDRKSVIGDLAAALMQDVLRLPSNRWRALADEVTALGSERHIQLFSFRPAEQALIRDIGWSGALETAAGDYLQFNEASLNSTKLNLLIQPEAVYRIELTELGDARHELRLRYRNTLPQWQQGRDPELVSKLMLGGVYGGYLRAFVPATAVNQRVEIDGVPTAIEDAGRDGAYAWFGLFMPLPSGEQREVVLRWSVPLAIGGLGAEAGTYRLRIQKQAGTRGMCMAVSVRRAGAEPATLRIVGGSRDALGRVCLTDDVTIEASF